MGRAPCCEKNGLKRGPWTTEEDQKLIDYINKNGCGNWRTLPKNAGLERCGKSCRLRWTNYLRPDIKRGRFSFEEEETIIQLHSILGNKWSAIAARLPGRTDNEIKNYWNTHIRKRLLRMGIDPITHTPRLDLLDLSTILNSSIYNNSSQMSLSMLLRMQNLINPELLRLATALLSSQRQNHDFDHLMQNQTISDNNTPFSDQIAPSLLQSNYQMQPLLVQDLCTVPTCVDTTSCAPISGLDANFNQFVQYENDWNQSNAAMFSTSTEDFVPMTSYNNSSDFNSQSFMSNISTLSSNSTPLNSNYSNNVNSSSTTTTTTTTIEDERESYCSGMMKFEVPDNFLDVNDYFIE